MRRQGYGVSLPAALLVCLDSVFEVLPGMMAITRLLLMPIEEGIPVLLSEKLSAIAGHREALTLCAVSGSPTCHSEEYV
ncbi:MAG: hypothetical protein VYD68_08495 [Pseudomonadota bacterium]|nr:hypothetical protein [Pseudomonadota bacterium]